MQGEVEAHSRRVPPTPTYLLIGWGWEGTGQNILKGRNPTELPDSLPLGRLSGCQHSPSLSLLWREDPSVLHSLGGTVGVYHTQGKCTAVWVSSGVLPGKAGSLLQETSWMAIYSVLVLSERPLRPFKKHYFQRPFPILWIHLLSKTVFQPMCTFHIC